MVKLAEAIQRFDEWFEAAKANEKVFEPNAMTLSTARHDGRPAARTVLLKGFDEQGFVFYTNTLSRKGQHLAANPQAALVFHWAVLARQVLVEGSVDKVSDAEADEYFASRPRLSQLGAWSSVQSELLPSKEAFETRIKHYEAIYADREVERPPHWTGYRVTPSMIEFWEGKEGRLHDRDRYFLDNAGQWQWSMIYP